SLTSWNSAVTTSLSAFFANLLSSHVLAPQMGVTTATTAAMTFSAVKKLSGSAAITVSSDKPSRSRQYARQGRLWNPSETPAGGAWSMNVFVQTVDHGWVLHLSVTSSYQKPSVPPAVMAMSAP